MKYQVLQEIYSSPRVRVEKVRAQYDNQTYIQKTFLQNKNEALNAIKVLNQTTNQFILNVIEYFENDEEQLVMIQEYCDQGDLKTFTMQHIGFKMQESIIWSILLQLAYGILELNEMGYQHRCLIPENIFLLGRTDGYQIRITDFTKASKQTLCQAPCPPVYLPYEYYFSGQYTQKSHIWQFGHILYFMMTQKLLFPLTSLESQVKEQLRRGKVQTNIPSAIYSEGLIQLVQSCLTIRESSRPNILQIIRLPQFKEALEKPYYVFQLDQRRHLQKWINSTETSITKPVLYSQNEFDLRSPRQIHHDVQVKKSLKNDRLPEIYQHKLKTTSVEPIKESKTEQRYTSDYKPQFFQPKHSIGVVKPISYHKKQLNEMSKTSSKGCLPYLKELDGQFKTLIQNKIDLCTTWIGDKDYNYLKTQMKFNTIEERANKEVKLRKFVEARHPHVDSSVILEQINHINDIDEQKNNRKKYQ